jgi:hypothetical protein
MLPIGYSWGRRHGLNSLRLASWPVLCTVLGVVSANGNLEIDATFDSTITGDPNATIIKRTINSVLALYEANFSDPIKVTITFKEMSGGLGGSSSYHVAGVQYATVRAKLAVASTTANDTNALAHLSTGNKNPVNGGSTLSLNLPNGRALGFAGWDPPEGQTDGTIYLNTSIMNLDRITVDPAKYDLFAIAAHEIDEVLGLASALDGLTNGQVVPTSDVWVMDLFRYDDNGNRSFNTAISSQAWFSLDGTNLLVRFNQGAAGDFHDWFSPGGQIPHVQDAFATPGATPDPTVEFIALDVIGYHLLAPTVTISNAGHGRQTIAWSPRSPGFVLQECTNLMPATWFNSVSGTNNPVTITNTTAFRFFRVVHP